MSKTVVLIHGNFVSKRSWDPWVERYQARGYTCLAPGYPGRDGPVAELRRNPDPALMGSLTITQVIEHLADVIRGLPEKPIVVGHSFGGLLTQQMVKRDLATAAVAISSVPPQGIIATAWPFYRSTWPVINPLVPASRPYLMPFEHFQYAFVNDLPLAEQRAAWELDVVPESRRLARGGLSAAARVDFTRPHAPLLLIGAEKDQIMPASVNRQNFRRYRQNGSVTEYKEFPGRGHYSIIGSKGWEEVADYALDWAAKHSNGR